MNGGSMVVEIRADSSRAAHVAPTEPTATPDPVPAQTTAPEPTRQEDWIYTEEEPDRAGTRRALAIAATVLSLAWVVGMLWAARGQLGQLTPVGFAQFVAALAIVPALIGILWLVGLRTSRAEAQRFGATAAAMQGEAARLEATMLAMGNHVEEHRRRLAAQVDELIARGDAAEQRLATLGSSIAGEVATADRQARGLAEAAETAKASVAAIVEALPRARAETEDAARLLDVTAESATEHAARLKGEFAALAEQGREADRIAGTAAQTLADHLTRMDGTSQAAATRLESVTAEMSGAIDALLDRTAQAVDQSRQGIAAQGDAVLAMMAAHQATLDGAARDSAELLAQRIGHIEGAIDRVAARLDGQRASGDTIVTELETGLERVEGRMAALHQQGVERSQQLAASIQGLGGSADAMTEALRAGEDMATRTIGTTESLLIALDSAAREIDETLPDALTRLDARIAGTKATVASAKPDLLAMVTAAESTHDAIEAIAGVVTEQRRVVDQLSTTLLQTLTEGRTRADALGTTVDDTVGRTQLFAEEVAPRLLEALLRVRETAQVAAEKAREVLSAVIPEAAAKLEEAGAQALRRATNDTVDRQIAAITEATAAAVDASARATERLAGQVQAIADQTAIVETRLQDARTEREEQSRDTFSRRASELIESLNAASIDITRSFAPEVADTAWAAYLNGDHGVFTRRAVRLLDGAQARAIATLHDSDAGFRDGVNRYIHDFEAMLRSVLAQRDGSALGMTILSSDIGKLYVALAQAIERLR